MATVTLRPDFAPHPRKSLHLSLWVLQGLVAVVFAIFGVMMLLEPKDRLVEQLSWAAAIPVTVLRFIGACELLGAVGLVAPGLAQKKTELTRVAGVGLTTLSLFACLFLLVRRDYDNLLLPFVLGCLSAFIVWGRSNAAPLPSQLA
jgi:hypothetical protein